MPMEAFPPQLEARGKLQALKVIVFLLCPPLWIWVAWKMYTMPPENQM